MEALDVVGIGNAIVDVLKHVDDAFLRESQLEKGSMNLIDAEQAEAAHRSFEDGMQCSGGSAANTMVGIASLGGAAAYIGRVRNDALGMAFVHDIRAAGVEFETQPAKDGPGTALCLIAVTDDAQRTMQTFLGASALLGPEEIHPETIRRARITYLEGYLFDPPAAQEAFLKAARVAHESGGEVALSLSDSFCVDRHREAFLDLVEHHVDILFANETEICSLYRVESFDEAARHVRGHCPFAALTRGPQGSTILDGERVLQIEADRSVRAVDTTGAGDLYAGGVLFALSRGKPAEIAGRIGSIAAGEVVGHYGARPETRLDALVRSKLL